MPAKTTLKRGQVVTAPFPLVENPKEIVHHWCLILQDFPYPPECCSRPIQTVTAAYMTSSRGTKGTGILNLKPNAQNGLAVESWIYFCRIQTLMVNTIQSIEGVVDPAQFEPVLLAALQVRQPTA